MAATLIDVARLAGVSIATASRVLNGSGNRKSKTQTEERVRSAARALDYRPNGTAQAVIRSATRLIGLVIPDIGDPYFSSLAKGVQVACAKSGTLLLLAGTDGSVGDELRVVRALISQRVEGVILAGSRCSNPRNRAENALLAAMTDRYTDSGGRVVTIGEGLIRDSPGSEIVLRIQEEKRAAELAAAMAADGCHGFTIFAGPEHVRQSDRRVRGFLRGLRESGAPKAPVLRGAVSRQGGLKAGQEIRRSISRDQDKGVRHGILAVNDMAAMGIISTLSCAGLESPRDYAIAGFDDIPELQDFWPPLSTVRLPLHQIGRRAGELALGRSAKSTTDGELMLRDTTAQYRNLAYAQGATGPACGRHPDAGVLIKASQRPDTLGYRRPPERDEVNARPRVAGDLCVSQGD